MYLSYFYYPGGITMSLLFACLFLLAVFCLYLGLRKSTFSRSSCVQQHCSACGWTREVVRSCEFEYRQATIVAPLCFECAIKHEATPVKAQHANTYREAYA